MSELDLRKSPWNDGLAIPGEFLDQQLYLLACMVNASRSFDGPEMTAHAALRQQFQEVEIGRLLLTIAAAVRNGMDQNPARAEHWMEGIDDKVGSLYREGKDEQTLSFREACNKIIHCLSLNFHYVSEQPRRGMALEPLVHIYGFKGKEEWKATIELNEFIRVANQVT